MIGVGIDAVEVPRFRKVAARTPGIIDRLFTDAERAYCERRKDPTERFAARFAAKEAVMKALGVGLGDIDFHDVEVVRHDTGAPSLEVRGRAMQLARDRGVTNWLVSLSHTEATAMAVVIAVGV